AVPSALMMARDDAPIDTPDSRVLNMSDPSNFCVAGRHAPLIRIHCVRLSPVPVHAWVPSGGSGNVISLALSVEKLLNPRGKAGLYTFTEAPGVKPFSGINDAVCIFSADVVPLRVASWAVSRPVTEEKDAASSSRIGSFSEGRDLTRKPPAHTPSL